MERCMLIIHGIGLRLNCNEYVDMMKAVLFFVVLDSSTGYYIISCVDVFIARIVVKYFIYLIYI